MLPVNDMVRAVHERRLMKGLESGALIGTVTLRAALGAGGGGDGGAAPFSADELNAQLVGQQQIAPAVVIGAGLVGSACAAHLATLVSAPVLVGPLGQSAPSSHDDYTRIADGSTVEVRTLSGCPSCCCCTSCC